RDCWRPAAESLRARSRDGRRVFLRHSLLDHAGHGPLRRPADVGRRARQRRAHRLPGALSRGLRPRHAARRQRAWTAGADGGAVPRLSGAERFGPLIVVFAILAAVAVWGSRRAAGAEWRRSGEAIRVGLIQGNVDQAEKVDVTRAGAIFQDYLRLTRQAIRE